MWLPILLLAVMASGSACPDFCQCRYPVIECREHAPKLIQLDELPSSYTELKIHDVEQEELRPYVGSMPNSTFLKRLQAIEVTNCSTLINLHYLKWDVPCGERKDFPILPNVRILNLSHNKLIDLPGHRTIDNKITNQQQVFDAGHNQVDSAVSTDCIYTPRLLSLSLANNNLDYISPNNFRYFQSIQYLDVSDNVLHTLEGMFDSLRFLQRLIVAGNKLEHVQASWFQNLGRLLELDISRNKLTFIPADTLQPLTSLFLLKLAENPLIERDLSLLLGTGRRLEAVDASRIGLVRVPAALTRSVRTLVLAGNQLTSINSGDLDSYPLLRLLDLSDNRLMIVEEDALGRLDGLETLILSGNILPSIPKSLPNGLKIFDLKQNAISKLKANDLQGLYLLKELNLSGNVISVIEGGSFRQLPALETLDISDNPIKKLPSDTLSGPSNLVTLRMSGLMSLETEENQNQDTAFPILTPERLVTLDVSRSPALAAQLLADNAALSACKSLQELDLSYTNISAMRSDLAYVLPQLGKLNLIGNEWNCTADQFWLGEWIRQHETSIKFSTRCMIPIEFEGKLLEEMPELPTSQTTSMYAFKTGIYTTITKSPEIKTSTTKVIETQEKHNSKEEQEIKFSIKLSSTPETTFFNNITDNLTKNNIQDVSNITVILKPVTTVEPSLKNQEMNGKFIEENDLHISTSIDYITEKTMKKYNEKEWPHLSTTNDPQKYTSKIINQESMKLLTHSTTPINFVKSNKDKILVLTASKIEKVFSTINDKKKPKQKVSTIIPTTRKTRISPAKTITTASTVTTTTMKPTTVKITTDASSTISSTSTISDAAHSTKMSFIKSRQPTLVKIDESVVNIYRDVKEDVEIHEKNPTNRAISEFSRSKLLIANDEPRVNVEPNSFAEELNSQATESGARTSESLTSGAHPGMLVLLGAAIGAAAALTVVLSRHATVKRRDRQYQRHENIEVHALTPTTELW